MNTIVKMGQSGGGFILLLCSILWFLNSCSGAPNEHYATENYPTISYFALSPDETQLMMRIPVEGYSWQSVSASQWGWVQLVREEGGTDLYTQVTSYPAALYEYDFYWITETSMISRELVLGAGVEYVIWNMESDEKISTFINEFSTHSKLSTSREYLAEYRLDDYKIQIRTLPEFTLWKEIRIPPHAKISDIAWSADDSRILVYAQIADAAIFEIDVASGTRKRLATEPDVDVAYGSAFDWDSDENLLLINDHYDSVMIFDLEANCKIAEMAFGRTVYMPTWTADGEGMWLLQEEPSLIGPSQESLALYDLSEVIDQGRRSCGE